MRWFANLSTGAKLSFSFGLVIVILLTMMGISYTTMQLLLNNNNDFLNRDLVLLESLMQLRDNQSDMQSNITLFTLSDEKSELDEFQKEIKIDQEDNKNLIQQLSTLQQDNTLFINKLSEIKKIDAELSQIYAEQIAPLVLQGKLADAQKIMTETLHSKFYTLGTVTVDMVNEVKSKVTSDLAAIKTEVNKATLLFAILGLIAILIVIGVIFILNRLISRPLKEISNATKMMAAGDLSAVEISSVGRTDEVGILADTFQIMRKSIHQMAMDISEIVNFLETAVNQISAATSQLVASSSETATAISQTSTTIEEVKQTSRTANEKAKLISETSKKSNEISATGNKAAGEMTDMTNQIQNQMQLIAESMLRLSEQGQAIGSIMATVEDMAQQSNLLSVNASIEAAKAGEQGKGFAIVAQEVKSLANQSKQATNQVREILSDIQKATSAAVMATEQGSKSVDMGVKKSEETGQSITSLVKTVTDSARDAMQIAATTHQQLVGMEQAATAMENIKTATFQNVEGSKQLEEAAKNIKGLGQKLKQLISQYKLQ